VLARVPLHSAPARSTQQGAAMSEISLPWGGCSLPSGGLHIVYRLLLISITCANRRRAESGGMCSPPGHERPGRCYLTGRCAYLPSATCYRQSIKPLLPLLLYSNVSEENCFHRAFLLFIQWLDARGSGVLSRENHAPTGTRGGAGARGTEVHLAPTLELRQLCRRSVDSQHTRCGVPSPPLTIIDWPNHASASWHH